MKFEMGREGGMEEERIIAYPVPLWN